MEVCGSSTVGGGLTRQQTRASTGATLERQHQPPAYHAQSPEEVPMSTTDALTSLESDGRTELREGYAEVGDVKLHYVEAGEGPLVVLLHGFPEFWYGWRLQIAPLAAAGFRVVAPDLRGYNLSSKP